MARGPGGQDASSRGTPRLTLHDLKQPLTLEVIPSATYSRRADPREPRGVRSRGLRPRRRDLGEVRGDLLDHGRGHGEPRLQPGGERRVPGGGEPALPRLLLGEAAVLHGGDGDLRAGRRRRGREHAHRRQHAGDRGPAVGRQGERDRRAARPSRCSRPATRPPGRQVPGEEENPFLGQRKGYFIGRGQYSLGAHELRGSAPHRHGVRRRPQPRGRRPTCPSSSATTSRAGRSSRPRTRSPDGLETKDGLAGQAFYAYETKPFLFATQAEHYDTDFQMDTAFVNQTGVTQGWSFIAPSFYPDAEEDALAQADRALRLHAVRQGPRAGRQRLLRAPRDPDAHDAPGLLPAGRRLGTRALGGAGLPHEPGAR